jgi:hypothetical protein
MRLYLYLLTVCVLVLGCSIASGRGVSASIDAAPTQALISPAQEIELALKAAPVHLRADATVYVFGKNGYERARTGKNGFTCMVNRDGIQNGDSTVHPTCWDPEGSGTILPVMLRVGELMALGKSAAEIKRDIDEGFAQGRFHSPAKAGIAYMLAGDVKFDPKSGQLSTTEFPAHYMIYAPGVSNADIGVTREGMQKTPGLPFLYSGYSGGAKTAYIIVMAQTMAAHTMSQ